jgi:hypothetical protein
VLRQTLPLVGFAELSTFAGGTGSFERLLSSSHCLLYSQGHPISLLPLPLLALLPRAQTPRLLLRPPTARRKSAQLSAEYSEALRSLLFSFRHSSSGADVGKKAHTSSPNQRLSPTLARAHHCPSSWTMKGWPTKDWPLTRPRLPLWCQPALRRPRQQP